jgi:hypothetical protein
MDTNSLVIVTLEDTSRQATFQAAYHRSLPEVRVEADCLESALDRLAARLALDLDWISDDFHRDSIQRALAEVEWARLGH